MKNVLVLTSTLPRWKNDTTPPFVLKLSESLSKKYNMILLAPHSAKAARKEKTGNMTVYRFRYFMPESLQKLAYGAGILTNVKKSFLAKLQIPSFLLSQLRNAESIVKKEKINLLHAHWMIPQGLIGAMLKKKYKIPMLVTIHGSDLFPLKNRFFKAMQKSILGNADIITVNSETAKNELLSRFPHLKSKIRIIPMGIDTTVFRPEKAKHLKYKSKIILFVGRLNEQKGVQYLIKAMPKITAKTKNAKLLIIGEGDYGKELENIAKAHNTEELIEFLGSKTQAEIAGYCNIADVFVLPSATTKLGTESFGLVLAEAMACGTPVIGSSSGGIKNIIKNGKNGLVFEEKNPDDLAEKVSKVLNDAKLKKRLSKNGLKYARQNYDWNKISKKFSSLYGQLLK